MIRLFLLLTLFLSACGNVGGLNLGQYPDPEANPQKFILCHGYNCSHRSYAAFSPAEWKKVNRVFRKKSKTAEIERQKIGEAIALMEKYIGNSVGTKDDLPKAPIVRGSMMELDCIDETINTTKYLTFLQEEGLLKFHTVDRPVYKGAFLDGVYPHNSASVQEIETGLVFVIDSYIYKNAEKPDIRPLESWNEYRVEDLEAANNAARATVENLKP